MIDDKRLTRQIQKVLSYNSENPPGNELALSKYIEKDMRQLGLDVKTYSFTKNRPNIAVTLKGTLPRKKAAVKSILITPHFDTVPIGEGWNYDPLGKDIVNGKVYGRGASDDKGNVAVCMEVMRSLVEDGFKPQHDIIMAATVDEETGSHYGIIPLLKRKILKPGYALILDSDEYHAIIAQKGLIHCRVQIFGKKAHGAYNWLGQNAIEVAARVINRLKRYEFPYQAHKILRPPTVNIGMISGGDKVNMVADFCEFAVDLRFLPGTSSRAVLKILKDIIRQETSKFKVEVDDIQQPYEIEPTHPFVTTYMAEAKKTSRKVCLKGSEGATVMTFFQEHRIPAFATGFGTSGTAHSTDEYAKLSILLKGACLLERFLINFDQCKGK